MKKPLIALLLAVPALMMVQSCGNRNTDDEIEAADTVGRYPYDLMLYELKGHPRKVTKTTYFDVKPQGDDFVIDSLGTNIVSSTIRFTPGGDYKPKDDESVKRDAEGRIVRWEYKRPTAKGVPLGFSKDTLEYRYVNGNHLVTDGMGAYAVIVYDDDRKIVGQYTVPRMNRVNTSAFNIYKSFDDAGNWTERVTVWSTQGIHDSLPSLNYSIDRREIEYYKIKNK